MAIVYTNVEDSLCKRLAYIGTSKFIYVTIDPAEKHQLNLPSNYKYYSILLQRKYADWSSRYFNFKIHDDDTFVCGYPKTGTTWIHNVVWQLKNNLDFDAPAKRSNEEYFEKAIMHEHADGYEKLQEFIDWKERSTEGYNELPPPRIFKSHLPAFLLPKEIWTKKTKTIYIARNPKDSTVSLYYNVRNNVTNYSDTLESLCETVISDKGIFLPFFDHINSYWQLRHLNHVLFLTYEDLKADTFGGVKMINDFLGCSYNDEQLKRMTDHVSFDTMREQFLENTTSEMIGKSKPDPDYRHCRKGKVGGYRDDLSEDMINRFNGWMAEKLKSTEFKFPKH